MTTRVLICAVIVLSMTLTASIAAAETSDPIAPIRDLVRAFEYDSAIEQAMALEEDTSATPSQRLQALALVGVVHLIEDRQNQAREAFERLLSLDPGSELDDPDLPPRVLEFFSETRSAYQPEDIIDADVDLSSGQDQLRITLSGITESVEELRLFAREGGTAEFHPLTVVGEGSEFTSELEPSSAGRTLEIYLEVIAPSGHVLERVGSADMPRTIELEMSENDTEVRSDTAVGEEGGGRRWYASWWFWTIVGVVVASGIVTAVVLTRPDEHQEGSLGSVQMPLHLSISRRPAY